MSLKFQVELEFFIHSQKLSEWEQKRFDSLKLDGFYGFLKGAVVSFSVVWPAFRAIPTASRLCLSAFAGLTGGRWNGGRSMEAGIDRLFGLQGTRIPTDLASLILREFKDDKSLLTLLRKHFYSEQVLSDVNPDVPRFRWRPRNIYIDSASSRNHIQADRVEFYQQSHQYKPTTEKSEAARSDSSENNDLPEKQNTTENRNWHLFVDPLESIFGSIEDSKETKQTRQSEAAEVLSRRQERALKRAHRRQRSNDATPL